MADRVVLDGELSLTNQLDGEAGTVIKVGHAPVIESLSVTENGTYEAVNVDGYAPVNVNIPIPSPVIESLSVTENGTYIVPDETDGFNPVTVNIPLTPQRTGTFIGDGTASVSLDVGFEPDAIVIDSDLDFATAGWQGIKCIIIVKGVLTINFCHNSTTDTTKTHTYYDAISVGQDPWGASTGAYRSYATYSDGMLLVTNKTPSNANVQFVNGQTYRWTAYKT